MAKEVKHFPICKGQLKESKHLAQGVKECSDCSTRFHILITSKSYELKYL